MCLFVFLIEFIISVKGFFLLVGPFFLLMHFCDFVV